MLNCLVLTAMAAQTDLKNEFLPLTKTSYGPIEEKYVLEALRSQKLEGDGVFTKKVQSFFESHYKLQKSLFTTSCTDALELSALLIDVKPGDEVIVPSYTFVSTAHAFALRGAKIVFADSLPDHPNMDISKIPALITNKTKAVVVVHYGGEGCQMDQLMELAKKHNFFVIEDAAQAVDAFQNGKALGSIGHLGAISFHQTKNISSGEGGLLIVNDPKLNHRAEILREKGTNRQAFFRGEVDKYTCVDIGSSYLGSDLNAALLFGQIERLNELQSRRLNLWEKYHQAFKSLPVLLPQVSKINKHNAHCYFMVFKSIEERTSFISYLKDHNISAPFHYVSLHQSPYYSKHHDGRPLPAADHFTDCLVRLPLYSALTDEQHQRIINVVLDYFKSLKAN